MDFEKLNKIASDLEEAHLPNVAFGVMESKDILAIVQAYRKLSAKVETSNEDELNLQCVNKSLDKEHIRTIFEQSRATKADFEEWFKFNYPNFC